MFPHKKNLKGTPEPSQEQNAVDAVMQYAIYRLGYKPEDIVVFAWSIGGYTATWAAMNYPDIKYLVNFKHLKIFSINKCYGFTVFMQILDATFDSIEPLATMKMPASWSKFVEFIFNVIKVFNVTNRLFLSLNRQPSHSRHSQLHEPEQRGTSHQVGCFIFHYVDISSRYKYTY